MPDDTFMNSIKDVKDIFKGDACKDFKASLYDKELMDKLSNSISNLEDYLKNNVKDPSAPPSSVDTSTS